MDLCDPWKCPPTKYAWGSLDSSVVMQKLLQEGFPQAKIQHNATGFIITIVRMSATTIPLQIIHSDNSFEFIFVACFLSDLFSHLSLR